MLKPSLRSRQSPRPRTAPVPSPGRASSNAPSTDETRWAAVVARDTSQAGEFYLAVATTGIYCRPGCPARLPKRSNVAFYETPDAAEAAGFRACKRCKPREASHAATQRLTMMAACRQIETAEEEPRLADLARHAGLSPHHFHRLFKSIVGVTPKAYAIAHRQSRVRSSLTRSNSVTEAMNDSGYNSTGRFYAETDAALGMTPTAYRRGGAGTKIRYAVAPCSLGQLLVAASDKGVCAVFFGDDDDALIRELRDRFPRAEIVAGDRAFDATSAKVVAFVDAPRTGLDLPLDIRGTAFQHKVWQALRDIPAGTTQTYAQVAERIGAPKAVRAVGTACGANPVAVAVPCHRVVRKDSTFPDANYRWGIARKQKLLDKEAKGGK